MQFPSLTFFFKICCGCIHRNAGTLAEQNRASGPLIQGHKQCDVTNPRWVLETQLRSSPRSASALRCWTFSPASRFNENKRNRKEWEYRREIWSAIPGIIWKLDSTDSTWLSELVSKCWLSFFLAKAIFSNL